MPRRTDMVIDELLTNIAMSVENKGFVADRIFPSVPVVRSEDYYAVYGKENFNYVDAELKRDAGFPVTHRSMSRSQYSLKEFGLAEFLFYKEIDEARTQGIDVRADTAVSLMQKMMLVREAQVQGALTTSASFTNKVELSGTDQWSHPSSDPIANVLTANLAIRESAGVAPNFMLVSYPVYRALLQNPVIEARLGANQTKKVTPEALSTLFEIDNIIVAEAQYNSVKSPGTSDIGNWVWGKNAFIGYSAPSPARKQVSLGYRFNRGDVQILDWDAPADRRGKYVGIYVNEVNHLTEEKCGYPIFDAIA